jgi:hypothetical protein
MVSILAGIGVVVVFRCTIACIKGFVKEYKVQRALRKQTHWIDMIDEKRPS